MATITINGISFDPAAPQPALAALSLDHADAKSSDYLVLQTTHPLNKTERTQLEKLGAKILEAVPGGLVCHFPGTSLTKIRALPFVSFAEVYPQVVKISPSLRDMQAPPGGVLAAAAALESPGHLDDTRVTVDVVLHRHVNPTRAAKKIAEAAHVPKDSVKVGQRKVRLVLKSRRLTDVAALDEVRHLEKVFPRKLVNNVARTILRTPAPSTGSGSGEGEIVAIADTGFDKGSTINTHPAFKGRVKKLYALGRPGRKDDPDGHGTHVAGSVLGNGVSKTDGPIPGTAPAARLVLQSVLDSDGSLGGLPNDLADLFTPPYKTDKARVHTNSWTSDGNFGVYDQQAFELDDFVYTNRDLVVCFAAGNDGTDANSNGQIDMNSITPPATAKNCITVGASENLRPNFTDTYGEGWPKDYPANPIKSDPLANNPEGIVAFSSRGPTNDGRIKPDVVAPGTYILSTRSRATKSKGWKLSSDPLYMFDGGTSMATPLVAGCVAVVRAYLRTQQNIKKPSAALIKAALINGAHDLAGQYTPSEAGTVPNNNQGFGRVDVQSVIGPYNAKETVQFFDESKKLDTADQQDRTFTMPAGTQRLKATLVWSDPPGEGLQSDLDLIVRAKNQERHGNMSATSTDFDRKNNVEQVIWEGLAGAAVTVSVRAHAITAKPQTFALVIRMS